jgi:hypothetical protein
MPGNPLGNFERAVNVLISGALDPGQELLDRPVISGPCVSVADWDCKKLKEFLPGVFGPARSIIVGGRKGS